MKHISTTYQHIETLIKTDTADTTDFEVQRMLAWCWKIYDQAIAGVPEYKQALHDALKKLTSKKKYLQLLIEKYPEESQPLLTLARQLGYLPGGYD